MSLLTRVAAVAALVPLGAAPLALSAPSWAVGSTSTSKAISRVHLVNGADVVADQRTFHLTVGSTQGLRDRQGIQVSWSGARPTRFVVPDPNSLAARNQENPVVLLQCRGVDSASVPASQRLSPSTCWTQSNGERFFTSPGVAFPPWRVDRYAAAPDRVAVGGAPSPLPAGCSETGYTEHWLPFVAASGHVYEGGLGGCGGTPPEATVVDSTLGQPGNTTYAATGADGRGSARFIVWSAQTNASLGCSESVPCSLVVVPIEGISCDVAAAGLPADERPTGDDATQAQDECAANGGASVPDPTLRGELWWSASNWRNRVVVPLRFNRLPGDCGGAQDRSAVTVYGSELVAQATQSWGSTFCRTASLFPFRHVQTGEPQARTILSNGSVDAAFTSFPPDTGYARPVVTAPAALTGFVVGYTIDDADGHPYRKLRLTPRLLAKLMTESYPAIQAVKAGYPALAANPEDMSLDPEFQVLNPGIRKGVAAGISASTLGLISADSDVVYALTSYLHADPEARAWIAGAPDPWGMVVNPNYKGMSLPTASWPLLDTFQPTSIYNETNVCLQANPVPYLPLVAAPQARLSILSLDLQYAIAPSQTECKTLDGGGAQGAKLQAVGRQPIGSRFLLCVTSWADAVRYQIDTAALQTRAVSAGTMSSDAGRTFVTPTSASVRAGGALLAADPQAGTWRLPYAKLAGASAASDAYPGTMLVSAVVPTSGVQQGEAAHLATVLRFLGGKGQVPGTADGQLPAGYVPLTAANGLGALSSYTVRAADAVAAQRGGVPSLNGSGGGTPVPTAAPVPTPADGAAPTRGGLLPSTGPVPAPVPSLAPSPGVQLPVLAAATTSPLAGWAGQAPALLAVLALVAGAAAGIATLLLRRTVR